MKAKFTPPDLSAVVVGERCVLDLTFAELLGLYHRNHERLCRRPDLRDSRLKARYHAFRQVSAWSHTPSHTPSHIGAVVEMPERDGYASARVERGVSF